jgi:hypothetical protein
MTSLSVIETIRGLQHCGRTLASDGKQLFVGPGQMLSDELAAAAMEHRDELVRIFTPLRSEADVEREAIQWADQAGNAEADAALSAASEWWRDNAFVVHATALFPGSRSRLLSEAEFKTYGFAEPREPSKPCLTNASA